MYKELKLFVQRKGEGEGKVLVIMDLRRKAGKGAETTADLVTGGIVQSDPDAAGTPSRRPRQDCAAVRDLCMGRD